MQKKTIFNLSIPNPGQVIEDKCIYNTKQKLYIYIQNTGLVDLCEIY